MNKITHAVASKESFYEWWLDLDIKVHKSRLFRRDICSQQRTNWI